MIYLIFLDPDIPVENKELAGMHVDVIEAQELAADLSTKSPGSLYEVRKYQEGKLNGVHWSCDDLANDGEYSSTWQHGRCVKDKHG